MVSDIREFNCIGKAIEVFLILKISPQTFLTKILFSEIYKCRFCVAKNFSKGKRSWQIQEQKFPTDQQSYLFLALTFKRPLNLPRPVYPRGGGGVTCNMKLRPSRHFCSVANSAIGLRSLVRVLFPICLTDKRGISFSGSIFGNMVVSFYVFRYLCVFSPQQLKYVHVFT